MDAGEVGLSGQVDFVEHLGDAVISHIKVAGINQLLTVKTSASLQPHRQGDRVSLRPLRGECLVFDRTGQRVGAQGAEKDLS
jgi:hypothetical protein